jgi:hypothetical protein
LAFDGIEFYCPGCWVDLGRLWEEWGQEFKIGKKRLVLLKREINDCWNK